MVMGLCAWGIEPAGLSCAQSGPGPPLPVKQLPPSLVLTWPPPSCAHSVNDVSAPLPDTAWFEVGQQGRADSSWALIFRGGSGEGRLCGLLWLSLDRWRRERQEDVGAEEPTRR